MKNLISLIFLTMSFLSYGQTKISGTVKDSHGEPIYGVKVNVKGTSRAVITDIDGKYVIEALGTETLVFSVVGHKTSELPINGRTVIDLSMGEGTETLDDMIVVAYGVQKKASFTGSANVVSADKLVTAAPVESVDKALQGKAAGVRVSSASGDPGASGEVQIRGIGSINAGTQPLYIIDGVPMLTGNLSGVSTTSSNVLSTLNMDDIASLTVLKDAAASSLYGSRAANGVIIITTKKGKSGETKFNFKSTLSISNFAVTESFDVMNSQQYVEYTRDAHFNRFMYDRNALPGMVNSSMYNSYSSGAKKYANERLKSQSTAILPSNFDAYDQNQVKNLKTYNVKDYVLNDAAVTQDYQFSASGGEDKTKFFASVSYNDNKGIVKYTEFDRLTGRLNLDRKLTENTNLSLSQLLSFTDQLGIIGGENSGTAYSNNPLYMLINWSPLYSPWDAQGKETETTPNNLYNPLTDNQYNLRKTAMMRSMSNASFDWNIVKDNNFGNLFFKSNFGYDYVNTRYDQFRTPTTIGGMFTQPKGNLVLTRFTTTTLTNNNVFTYNKSIDDMHDITFLIGNEIDYRDVSYLYNYILGYATDKIQTPSAGSVMSSFDGWDRKQRLQSYLSKLDYSFNNKYYFGASFRMDGSSMLAPKERWGNFWSVSGSWRISKEEFMSNLDFVNDLKLKASYGTNGTLPTDFFMFGNYYSVSGSYNDNPIMFLNTVGNPNLTWEKSNNLNIGIDVKLFDIFDVELEYYNKITKDLLLDVPVSYIVGTTSMLQNNGKISNDGIELSLTSTNMKTENFSWTTTLMSTYMRTKVLALANGQDVILDGVYIYREGMPMYTFYATDYVGLNTATGEAIFVKNTPQIENGVEDLKIITDNRYTSFRPDARANATNKKAYPDFAGSLTNDFNYNLGKDIGKLSLSFMFTYSLGGWMIDRTTTWGQTDGSNSTNYRNSWATTFDYWKTPGDDTYTPMPIQANPRSQTGGDRAIFSTDHIRLKDISMSYSLPTDLCKSIKLESVRINISGANLLTFSYLDDLGIDPEVPILGFRALRTPPLKSFTVGLNVNF